MATPDIHRYTASAWRNGGLQPRLGDRRTIIDVRTRPLDRVPSSARSVACDGKMPDSPDFETTTQALEDAIERE